MRPIRRKIEEVKRRSRERKLSIVSTVELLRKEEHDEIVNDESTRGDAGTGVWQEDEVTGSPKTVAAAATAAEKVKEETTIDDDEKVATMVEEKETAAVTTAVPGKEEEKGLEFGGEEEDDDDEKGRKFGSFSADEELPGSPSFRFYCKDLERDLEDDSVKFDADGTRDKLSEIIEKKKKAYERGNSTDSNSNEDLDVKPLKKDKGRKLKALTKAPGHVYNFLNVRNCCNNSCSSATSRDREGLLDGKTDL
ncbi:hypothetical protein COCNU_scaffold006828G000020 [Cocos nucifera]|nr:hypothetical protein [Cocos nucifera]